MINIRVNEISTTPLEEIINTDLYDYYKDNIQNRLSNTTNKETITILQYLDKDIKELYQSLINFKKYLNNYIEDYKNIELYLKSGKLNNINNPNLQTIISNSKPITDIKLEDFNIPNKQLYLNYEEKF